MFIVSERRDIGPDCHDNKRGDFEKGRGEDLNFIYLSGYRFDTVMGKDD